MRQGGFRPREIAFENRFENLPVVTDFFVGSVTVGRLPVEEEVEVGTVTIEEVEDVVIVGTGDDFAVEAVETDERTIGVSGKRVGVEIGTDDGKIQTVPGQFEGAEFQKLADFDKVVQVFLSQRAQTPTSTRNVDKDALADEFAEKFADDRGADVELLSDVRFAEKGVFAQETALDQIA
jgi:hypothetical protein